VWGNDGTLSPLDVYCYLKARFGPPNGTAMLLRHPSTENVIQWQYTVLCDEWALDITGLNARMELMAAGPERLNQVQWLALAVKLKSDMASVGPQMSRIRRGLERWTLFVNPFQRINEITETLEERLKHLDTTPPTLPPSEARTKDNRRYMQRMGAWVGTMANARSISTTLRMLAPVLGESFVNLLIFMLVKPDVRKDQRRYDDLLRRQIDIRIKDLSLFCSGFAKPVDGGCGEFEAFHRLMNYRNDLLHGNVSPELLRFDEVYFDQRTIPLFKDEQNLVHRMVTAANRYVEPESALDDLKTVRAFIEYLISCLEPAVGDVIKFMMTDSALGWSDAKGRIGSIFKEIPLLFMGDKHIKRASD